MAGTGFLLFGRAFQTSMPSSEAGQQAPKRTQTVSMVGIDPALQGQKLGSKLIRSLSTMADSEGLPCYLECSGKKMRDMYVHLGYEEKACETVSVDRDVAGHAPFEEFYAMLRPAQKQ